MSIMEEINNLADTLVELVEKDRNHARVKELVQNCGDVNLQREWNSLTEEEQRAVSDELYYHFCAMKS